MLTRLFVVCCILPLIMSIMAVEAAKIAVVDFADQWTGVDALRQTLDDFNVEYDDLTDALESGDLPFKADNKIFLIGSVVTSNAVLHENLDKNAKVIQEFVNNGGVVWESTQNDIDEANVDWLPRNLRCVRGDLDSSDFKIRVANHSLFNKPNRIREKEFKELKFLNWQTAWDIIDSQKGFRVLMESSRKPVIMEAKYGKGRFLLMSIAIDKYHIVGNDDNIRDKAKLFMENLLNYAEKYAAVEANGKLTTKWGKLKM